MAPYQLLRSHWEELQVSIAPLLLQNSLHSCVPSSCQQACRVLLRRAYAYSVASAACDRSTCNVASRRVQALGSLPGEKLARVLEIISEGNNALATGGSVDEVELDIDMLDNATLFKLDQYANDVLAVRRLYCCPRNACLSLNAITTAHVLKALCVAALSLSRH